MERRVVVTGAGALTPLGIGVEATWQAARNGRSGIDYITLFDTTGYSTRIGGEVKGFAPEEWIELREVRHTDRFVQFAVAAATQAVQAAGLETPLRAGERAGVVIGSGIGGTWSWEAQHQILLEKGPNRISPYFIPQMIMDMASGRVAMQFGAKGPNLAIVTACATSTHAIGEAAAMIRRDDADIMISGGSEAAVSPMSVAGFCALRALSKNNADPKGACRPFDRDRDGFVIAEGAGILVLEELEHAKARGAQILGEILGYGATADAYHLTAPCPDGDGMARAMKVALRNAQLTPDRVDYINAHGTGTKTGDGPEALAIERVFGAHTKQILVSSTKSMHGHLLGAAGAVELLVCLLAIRDQVVPPTINLDNPDPVCDLNFVPHTARETKVKIALSNSFGFGGHNATLIVGAPE